MPAAGFHRSGCGCLTARAKEPWRVRRVGSDERTGEPRERKKQTPTTRTEAVTPSEHLSALGMTLEFVNRKLHNKLTRPTPSPIISYRARTSDLMVAPILLVYQWPPQLFSFPPQKSAKRYKILISIMSVGTKRKYYVDGQLWFDGNCPRFVIILCGFRAVIALPGSMAVPGFRAADSLSCFSFL